MPVTGFQSQRSCLSDKQFKTQRYSLKQHNRVRKFNKITFKKLYCFNFCLFLFEKTCNRFAILIMILKRFIFCFLGKLQLNLLCFISTVPVQRQLAAQEKVLIPTASLPLCRSLVISIRRPEGRGQPFSTRDRITPYNLAMKYLQTVACDLMGRMQEVCLGVYAYTQENNTQAELLQ